MNESEDQGKLLEGWGYLTFQPQPVQKEICLKVTIYEWIWRSREAVWELRTPDISTTIDAKRNLSKSHLLHSHFMIQFNPATFRGDMASSICHFRIEKMLNHQFSLISRDQIPLAPIAKENQLCADNTWQYWEWNTKRKHQHLSDKTVDMVQLYPW